MDALPGNPFSRFLLEPVDFDGMLLTRRVALRLMMEEGHADTDEDLVDVSDALDPLPDADAWRASDDFDAAHSFYIEALDANA